MDILRRNTDYALRLVVNMAGRVKDGPVSARLLAQQEDVSSQLASKLLQKLNSVGLVESRMGPQGGFLLAKEPGQISLGQVVEAIQGPVSVNRCMLGEAKCERRSGCPISGKLEVLQARIDEFMMDITIGELLKARSARPSSG